MKNPNNSRKRIAHISPKRFESSSSFIQSNIKGLDGEVVCFYGGYLPTYREHKHLAAPTLWERIAFSILGSIAGLKKAEYTFYRELRKEQIDLVFVEYGPTANAIYSVIEKLKIPLVIHFHGFDVYHKKTLERHGFNYRRLIPHISLAIAVSLEMKQELMKWGIPESKILYSPCGCQLEFTGQNNFLERNGFIAVGGLVPKKSPITLLKAFVVALSMGSKYDLTIMGDGPLRDECEQFISANNLKDRVKLLGQVDHEEVVLAMQMHSIFVQHSVTSEDGNKEGTPVAVLEAQAMQLPVISTRHAGIPDVVVEGKTGFLVEENDFELMGKMMFQLEMDAETRKKMGVEAYKWVTENWTSAHHLNRINQRIQSI